MNRYYYDLHIHSCLSPCGDEDNTPNNIAGMASLCGLNIVALTDHNTTKNCPAFFTAARRHGIIPIAGMELTTSEDIHVVCLFEELDDAMAFGEFVQTKRVLIKNRVEIFGEQTVLDGEDNPIGTEEYFLPNATEIS
ncbi:MAG: PHP domain-containing protein, partial [Clostridia bacterium]|nr:PHP domain-containing protein [Clostridia bacterium]